jgi:hypothetical protein
MQEIKITGATIFVNPFKDEMEAEAKAEEEKLKEVAAISIAAHMCSKSASLERCRKQYAVSCRHFQRCWSASCCAAGGEAGGAADRR